MNGEREKKRGKKESVRKRDMTLAAKSKNTPASDTTTKKNKNTQARISQWHKNDDPLSTRVTVLEPTSK